MDFVNNLRSDTPLKSEYSPWMKNRREHAAVLLQKNFRAFNWNRRFRSWHSVVARLKSRVSLRSKKAKVRSQLMFLKGDGDSGGHDRAGEGPTRREAELLHLLLELDQDGHAKLEVVHVLFCLSRCS